MAKWKSVLFSDIRNKLGDSVVFSMWKGRPYMRSYVVPANPNSLAQQANRLHMAAIVLLYQTNVKNVAANKAAWNLEALPKLVSGYNIFAEYGRQGSQVVVGGLKEPGIVITSLKQGEVSIEIVASAIPIDRLALMTVTAAGAPIELPTTKRGLGTYLFSDWTTPPVSTNKIYVVNTKVLAGADVEATARMYKAVNHWVPNEITGVIRPMVVTAP